MADSHWIITNRPAINGKKKGDYVDEDHDSVRARPEFRIARFTPPEKTGKKAYEQSVEFIQDEYVESYESMDGVNMVRRCKAAGVAGYDNKLAKSARLGVAR